MVLVWCAFIPETTGLGYLFLVFNIVILCVLGHWVHYGFGMVCLHTGDYRSGVFISGLILSFFVF